MPRLRGRRALALHGRCEPARPTEALAALEQALVIKQKATLPQWTRGAIPWQITLAQGQTDVAVASARRATTELAGTLTGPGLARTAWLAARER